MMMRKFQHFCPFKNFEHLLYVSHTILLIWQSFTCNTILYKHHLCVSDGGERVTDGGGLGRHGEQGGHTKSNPRWHGLQMTWWHGDMVDMVSKWPANDILAGLWNIQIPWGQSRRRTRRQWRAYRWGRRWWACSTRTHASTSTPSKGSCTLLKLTEN